MEQFWRFVFENKDISPEKLRLKYHGRDTGFDTDLAITQIECRRKFGKKLSQTLDRDPQWLFPSTLAGEQSTSDRLAAFHASLVGSAHSIVDLTAGLGIDAIHFPERAKVTAIDIEESKIEALRYNIDTLGLKKVTPVCADCRDFIASCDEKYDVAFIDPARRGEDGKRLYALADCRPDVVAMLPEISRIAKRLIIKMSPMLDIANMIESLPGVRHIIALGTATECKELIADIVFDTPAETPEISAVTLTADSEIDFSFTRAMEMEAACTFAGESRLSAGYILEPYPAVMKAGPFRLLSASYGIDKLASNTNLYFSDKEVPDFPGETWRILKVVPYESRFIKRLHREFPELQVATRNFPISADALRAKLRVADRGPLRLFAVTLTHPTMIITTPDKF